MDGDYILGLRRAAPTRGGYRCTPRRGKGLRRVGPARAAAEQRRAGVVRRPPMRARGHASLREASDVLTCSKSTQLPRRLVEVRA